MDSFAMQGLEASAGHNLSKAQLEKAQRLGGQDQVSKAAEEFEKLMATMLVKEMRSTLKNGFFPKGPGNDTYNAWFDEKIAESLSNSDSLGLAGQLKTKMGSQSVVPADKTGPHND